MDELKRSIAAVGVLQPLWVRVDTAERTVILVDGECRLRAVKELRKDGIEIKGVPVMQVPGGNEPDRLVTALTANTGKPLSKWEMGGAFRRLINFGWSPDQIATKTGYTVRFIAQSIELSDAPEDIKYLLSEQAVTPSLALSEIRKSGSGAALVLKQKVEENKAKGNSKPVKREKAPPQAQNDLMKLLKRLFKDVPVNDLDNRDNEYISVSRVTLQMLYLQMNGKGGK